MYLSLSESGLRYDYTPRLFHLTSWTGTFRVEEIASLTKVPDLPCAYPFLQVCIFPTRLDSSGFCSSSLTSGFLNRVLIDSAVFVIAEWVVQCQPTDTLLVGQWRRSVAVAGLVARRWEQGEQHHRGEKTSLDWRASLRLRNGPGLLPSEEGEEPSEGISGVGWARTSLFHLPVPELGARWTCNWNQCSGKTPPTGLILEWLNWLQFGKIDRMDHLKERSSRSKKFWSAWNARPTLLKNFRSVPHPKASIHLN